MRCSQALICPSGRISALPIFLSSPFRKNILIFRNRKSVYIPAIPPRTKGAFRDRHGRGRRDAVDAGGAFDERR
jgi:hypothetical protein